MTSQRYTHADGQVAQLQIAGILHVTAIDIVEGADGTGQGKPL